MGAGPLLVRTVLVHVHVLASTLRLAITITTSQSGWLVVDSYQVVDGVASPFIYMSLPLRPASIRICDGSPAYLQYLIKYIALLPVLLARLLRQCLWALGERLRLLVQKLTS